eukprot:Gb_05958 [translate_table: standard]
MISTYASVGLLEGSFVKSTYGDIPRSALYFTNHHFSVITSAKQNSLRSRQYMSIRAIGGAIPPPSSSSSSPTLYDVLSVGQNVGLGEIKSAYRQMVRVYHPDVCPPAEREECSKMFLQIQEAYETLSDPLLRADYDYRLTFISSPMQNNSYATATERRQMGKDQWKEQLQNLKRRSASTSSARDTWGAKMRRSRDEQAHELVL